MAQAVFDRVVAPAEAGYLCVKHPKARYRIVRGGRSAIEARFKGSYKLDFTPAEAELRRVTAPTQDELERFGGEAEDEWFRVAQHAHDRYEHVNSEAHAQYRRVTRDA